MCVTTAVQPSPSRFFTIFHHSHNEAKHILHTNVAAVAAAMTRNVCVEENLFICRVFVSSRPLFILKNFSYRYQFPPLCLASSRSPHFNCHSLNCNSHGNRRYIFLFCTFFFLPLIGLHEYFTTTSTTSLSCFIAVCATL